MPKESPNLGKIGPKKKPNLVHDTRVRCGLEINKLAAAVEVSPKTIKRLEDGEPTIKIEIKYRVANELKKRDPKYDFAFLFPNG